MRQFDYVAPASLNEVIEQITETTRPLAGGTDLLPLIKADVVAPDRLISLRSVELSRDITSSGDGLNLGALVTLSTIEQSETLRTKATALAEAASLAASPQLRNMATIGGNLLQRPRCWYFRNHETNCWLKGGDDCLAREGENQHHALFDTSPCVAAHPSDLASALLALDAEIDIAGSAGQRSVAIGDFFAAPTDKRRSETTLANDEIITAVRLPTANGVQSTYLKAMDRKVWAFALVGVAAALRVGSGGTIEHARLVLSGVAPIPWRCEAAETTLIGQQPREALFSAAAEVALAEAKPLRQNSYKLPLARALIRQAFMQLAKGTEV